ncbi:unnamed protein product [Clavelina lepadiformis]|uniref:Uncharacterized protein n=1 Tax=Clavelina lepadiformis TaxID=159417 RepID=A0ABP0FV71_CLALP
MKICGSVVFKNSLVRGLFDNGVARLLSWCWPQLQALSFGGADIDGAGLLAVALNCQHLKVLELFHARGVAEDNAKSVCKHGLKELHTLIFTHTPVQAATLLCFLQTLNLHSLHVELTQRDFFTKSKYRKFQPEYAKISKALKAVQKNLKYKDVLDITWS